MNSEQGFQLGDLFSVVKRRVGLIGGIAGAVVLVAALVSSLMRNVYESKAILLIEPQTISRGLIESNLEESDLNSRLHLIQMQILSRTRLSNLIDEFNVYPEASQSMTREEIIEMMRDEISVTPLLSELEAQAGVRNREVQINTFQLAFRHANSNTAAVVANRLANSFVDEHLRNRTRASSDTSEFIDTELNRLAERIRLIESRVASVKDDNTGSLPEDFPANQRLHERIIQQIRDVQRDLALAESDEAFYGQQVTSGGSDFYKYRGGNDMTPERRLEALRIQLGEFEAKRFTDRHPDMVSTRAEIADLEAQVAEVADSDEEVADLSIAQQNARAEQRRSGLRAVSNRADIERLRTQLEVIEARMAATPRVQEQLSALEREHEHLFNSFQDFSAKQLDASVAADMERRQKGEKFRVLEAAVAEREASSPNRPVILVMSLLLGLGLGFATALLVEASDRSFHDARSLQESLGIPVLASVPEVVLASDIAGKRRRRMINAVAAVAVAGAVLVVSLAGNWYVNGLPGFVDDLVGNQEAAGAAADPE